MDFFQVFQQCIVDIVVFWGGVEEEVGWVVQYQVGDDGQLVGGVIGFQFVGGFEDGVVVEVEVVGFEYFEQVQVVVLCYFELVGLYDVGVDLVDVGVDGEGVQVVQGMDIVGRFQIFVFGQQYVIVVVVEINGEGDGFEGVGYVVVGGGGDEVVVLVGLDQLYVVLVGGGDIGDLVVFDGEGLVVGMYGQFEYGFVVVDQGVVFMEIGEFDFDDLCIGGR